MWLSFCCYSFKSKYSYRYLEMKRYLVVNRYLSKLKRFMLKHVLNFIHKCFCLIPQASPELIISSSSEGDDHEKGDTEQGTFKVRLSFNSR